MEPENIDQASRRSGQDWGKHCCTNMYSYSAFAHLLKHKIKNLHFMYLFLGVGVGVGWGIGVHVGGYFIFYSLNLYISKTFHVLMYYQVRAI